MLLHALGCRVMVSQVADTYTLRREACGRCLCLACAGLFARRVESCRYDPFCVFEHPSFLLMRGGSFRTLRTYVSGDAKACVLVDVVFCYSLNKGA